MGIYKHGFAWISKRDDRNVCLAQKQSLIGDAMAHAALPGICIAFLLYGQNRYFFFLLVLLVRDILRRYAFSLSLNIRV